MSAVTDNLANAASASPWAPLKIPVFRMLWFATLASSIGAWMHDVGAGWLMTSLSPTPVMVALVQTATTLPIFLLAMPAGTLSDIVDRRRYLIAVQIWLAVVAGFLGAFTLADVTTAWMLVGLTFAMGIGSALMMPAWAAVTPELVSREQLQPAIALNSLGINAARAIGPALAGVIVSFAGTGAVFVLNALSYLGVIVVLTRWQREVQATDLPAERFFGAMRTGLRFARHAPELQAAVIRGFGFILFASASWALLPLVAKNLVDGGPQAFGLLFASLGAGAVGGAVVLPKLREQLSRDVLVATATVLYAAAMVALAKTNQLLHLCIAMAVSGVAWITVLSSLQVAAQLALPNWVRARGLAVFMMIFMGSMALGSVTWGKVAEHYSIPTSLTLAAIGLLAGAVLTWRWRIGGIEKVDVTPSMHWPAPIVQRDVTHDRGPVLVTIRYDVRPGKTEAFLDAIRTLGKHRRRDGAFAWSVFEHTENPNHFIESFSTESWLEHLRQHERVTDADRILQVDIQNLLVPGSEPRTAHYVAPAKPAQRSTQ
jgi:MFS family permease